jgi:predicted adenylyl cyclase CyaB
LSSTRKKAGPPEERELKFATEGLEHVRERLLELEAERLGPSHFEDNWVLDKGGALEQAGCVLRVRADGRGARLTLKGPRRMEGHTRVRAEQETAIGDAGVAREIFEALGFQVVRRYQKMREEWRVGGVEVALDHTPIGDFVEFEGARGDVLAKRCGFDPAKAEQRSYLRLYADYLSVHPEAPPEMTFPEEPSR